MLDLSADPERGESVTAPKREKGMLPVEVALRFLRRQIVLAQERGASECIEPFEIAVARFEPMMSRDPKRRATISIDAYDLVMSDTGARAAYKRLDTLRPVAV